MSNRAGRSWRQFSLRALLALMTCAAILLAWFAWRLRQARVQDAAVEAIVRAGGNVAYASQFYGRVSRLTPYPPQTTLIGDATRVVFGTDPFRHVRSIELASDDSLALLAKHPLPDLQILRLGNSGVTDAGLVHIRNCTQVRVLYLEGASVTDRGLDNIREFKHLEELWLHNTLVTDEGLKKFAHLKSLSALDVRETQISDEGLAIIASMPAISLLYLDSPALTSAGLRKLGNAPQLSSVWLGAQASAKYDLQVLDEISTLESLTLTDSGITDAALQALASNRQIERLTLQACTGLTDESLSTLATLPKLKTLGTRGTPFTKPALDKFQAEHPNCTIW